MKPILLAIGSIESIEDNISTAKIVYKEISTNLIILIKQYEILNFIYKFREKINLKSMKV